MVEVFAAKRHYKFRFENLTEFRDFLLIFLHVKSTQGDVPLFLPNDYFNHIIELSLNNSMKTEDQKRKTSESIFNSQITDNNAPVNAIRRVHLKADGTRVPIGSSSIAEDVEGEDEEHVDERPVKAEHLAQMRVDAEESSEDDQPQLPKMEPVKIAPPPPADDSDDDKKGKKGKKDAKDAKDKKSKDTKKDSKKDEVDRGYNAEELTKGKNIMSNPGFQANLEKLKTQVAKSKGIDTGAGLKLGHSKKPSLSSNPKTDPQTTKSEIVDAQDANKIRTPASNSLQESEVISSEFISRDPSSLAQQAARIQNDSAMKSGLAESKGTNLRTLAMQNRLGESTNYQQNKPTALGGGLRLGANKPSLGMKKSEPEGGKASDGQERGKDGVDGADLDLAGAGERKAKAGMHIEAKKDFEFANAGLNKKPAAFEEENAAEWKVGDDAKIGAATKNSGHGTAANTLTIKKPGIGKKSQLKQEEDDDQHNNSWDEKNPFD